MAVMQISPSMSCIHLLPKKPVVWVCCADGVFMINHLLKWEWTCKALQIPVIGQAEQPLSSAGFSADWRAENHKGYISFVTRDPHGATSP
jgi:hypothetical protein